MFGNCLCVAYTLPTVRGINDADDDADDDDDDDDDNGDDDDMNGISTVSKSAF